MSWKCNYCQSINEDKQNICQKCGKPRIGGKEDLSKDFRVSPGSTSPEPED